MTTTSADEKVAEGKAVEGAMLDPDDADRFAALIKPAWEEDEPAHAAVARPSDEGRPTSIDPIPNVDVGDTLPTDNPPVIDAEALVASVESPASKQAPPAGSARAGATRMGIGNDPEVAAAISAAAGSSSVGATQLGLGDEGEVAAREAPGADADEDLIATQARPIASVPPPQPAGASAPPRPAAGAAPTRSVAASRAHEEPIVLPMNGSAGAGKMGIGIGIGLAIAGLAGLAFFLVKGGGDDAKTAPTAAATTAAAPTPSPKVPEITPPPIPAEPATPEPAKAEPSAEPAAEPPKVEPPKDDPPKSEPAKTEPKSSGGVTKPPAGPKPPAPGGPPRPPRGGIIRDAPF